MGFFSHCCCCCCCYYLRDLKCYAIEKPVGCSVKLNVRIKFRMFQLRNLNKWSVRLKTCIWKFINALYHDTYNGQSIQFPREKPFKTKRMCALSRYKNNSKFSLTFLCCTTMTINGDKIVRNLERYRKKPFELKNLPNAPIVYAACKYFSAFICLVYLFLSIY